MAVRWKHIRALSRSLLNELQITGPKVDIYQIVQEKGLSVRHNYDNDNDRSISGFLLMGLTQPIIGVNGNHSETRQRFTIAHELGHFLLHRYDAENLHVDYTFRVKLRDDLSSQGTDIEEREANYFAAELLMPVDFLERDLRNIQTIDFVSEDDEFIKELADNYGVSRQAMIFRLANLRYITL